MDIMIKRALGRTGLNVSQLGFGAMRLPMVGQEKEARVDLEKAIPLIHRAFEAGVNYIDSAVFYCNADSQAAVGKALKGWRDRIIVSTKNHYYDEDEKLWWQNLENSLQRLDVQYIDVYHHHGIRWQTYTEKIEPRVRKWMEKARDQGLVRHIACSFHDTPEALRNLILTGYPEVLTVQYNLLDRKLESAIALAHEKGIGVVVMGPVGGGRLGLDSPVLKSMVPGVERVPELALRFVLSNPNVCCAISGMNSLQQVTENVAVASDPQSLSPADAQAIAAHLDRLQKMSDLYCTGCAYCKPCPHEVDIPGIFYQYNLGQVWGLWDLARQNYQRMIDKHVDVSQCLQCGECEDKCPQHILIRQQLEQAEAALRRNEKT